MEFSSMTYHTNIRHQEIVALLGSRNLPLRLVYAHIANYTEAKGAWTGSKQKLADELELERTVVSRKLDDLLTLGVVVADKNSYRAVCTVERAERTEKRAVCTEKRAERTSPYNPLYNNIQMKRNENIARDTIATPSPEDIPSFERLLKIYFRNKSRFQFDPKMEEECRQLWDAYEFWKRKMLLEQLFQNRDGVRKPRLDWTLADFDPQPENMKGQPLEKDVKYRTAKWKGSWGMYSQKDIDDFCLELVQQPKRKPRKDENE